MNIHQFYLYSTHFAFPRYYHGGCVDDKVKRKLHLEPNEKASKRAKVSTTTDKAKAQKSRAKKAVPSAKSNPTHKLRPQQRNQLAKELRLLRKYFAIAQGIARNEEYKIFPSRSIDEIIQKLPSNSSELMQCWGIKEKRLAQYGSAILLVVQPYLAQNNNSQQLQQQQHYQQQQQQQQQPQQNQQQQQQLQVDNSDSDDEEVEITRQRTVEEIVAQRVREAEARGEVLEIL
jgi:transcription initiation factor IIF auxiliary subunit